MPRINLKPQSAEFEDEKRTRSAPKACDMPGCAAHGEHKAPKHRGLNEYYLFCLNHVSEYNRAWNFFDGMSETEIQDHMLNSIYGDRPTWKYGVNGDAEETLYRKAWQNYHYTEEEPPHTKERAQARSHGYTANGNTPEYEALALMGLEPPVTLDSIKIRYKALVKKHHPDLNRGCAESEELLKRINMAYTILKLAYQQFEELPDRP